MRKLCKIHGIKVRKGMKKKIELIKALASIPAMPTTPTTPCTKREGSKRLHNLSTSVQKTEDDLENLLTTLEEPLRSMRSFLERKEIELHQTKCCLNERLQKELA